MTCKLWPLLFFLARSKILLTPMVFCTFPLARIFWCRLVFLTFSIFATPLMKYCDLWLLINIHFALGRVDCAFHFGRSRARGIAKTRNVIPMLRGNHLFVWFLCSVGTLFSFFCNTSAVGMLEKYVFFLKNSTWFAHFCLFAVHGRSVMLCFFHALPATMLPTARGDHFSGLGFPFFQHLCGGNARKPYFLKISHIFTIFDCLMCTGSPGCNSTVGLDGLRLHLSK